MAPRVAVDLQPWESFFALLTAQPDESLRPARELRPEQSRPITGTWAVEFSGLGGIQKSMELRVGGLDHVTELENFSGHAQYTLAVELPKNLASENKTVLLDLGEVVKSRKCGSMGGCRQSLDATLSTGCDKTA